MGGLTDQRTDGLTDQLTDELTNQWTDRQMDGPNLSLENVFLTTLSPLHFSKCSPQQVLCVSDGLPPLPLRAEIYIHLGRFPFLSDREQRVSKVCITSCLHSKHEVVAVAVAAVVISTTHRRLSEGFFAARPSFRPSSSPTCLTGSGKKESSQKGC